MERASRTISAVSAIAGMSFGGTKEPTSISRSPAAASARIQAFFASVGMRCFAFCRPSRGPTSQMWTSGMDFELHDLLRPLGRAGVVHRGTVRVDRHRDRHVLDLELVDRLHAEVLEGEDARLADRFRHE